MQLLTNKYIVNFFASSHFHLILEVSPVVLYSKLSLK